MKFFSGKKGLFSGVCLLGAILSQGCATSQPGIVRGQQNEYAAEHAASAVPKPQNFYTPPPNAYAQQTAATSVRQTPSWLGSGGGNC